MRQAVRAIVIKDDQLLIMDRNKFGEHYCALVGGGIDPGETAIQAITRELKEETGIDVDQPRLAIVEDAGQVFGMQYIFLCNYLSGEPTLDPGSEEAKIDALGQNLYQPRWLAITELPSANLLPKELKQTLITCLANGFPVEPIHISIRD